MRDDIEPKKALVKLDRSNRRRVGKGAQRRAHVSVNADCKSAVGTLRFAHRTPAVYYDVNAAACRKVARGRYIPRTRSARQYNRSIKRTLAVRV
jgi:hypothetical protein